VFVLAATVCFVGDAHAVHAANNVPAAVQCPESPHCWAGTVTVSQVIDTQRDDGCCTSISKENDVTTVSVDGAGTIVEHESPTGETVFGGELGKGTASLDIESSATNVPCAPDGAPGTSINTLIGSVVGDGRVLVLPNDDEHPTSLTIAAGVDTNIATTSTENCNSFSRTTVGPGGGFTTQAIIDVPAGWDGLHLHGTHIEPIPGYDPATTKTAAWTVTWDLTRKARPGCPATSFRPTCGTDTSQDPGSQTITFGALADKTYGDSDFALSASASSGLAVAFSASGSCTVSAAKVHLTGSGACTVSASQTGNASYNAAPDVSQTFSVAEASQTITFGPLANKPAGDPNFAVSARASSGLAVKFSASGSCSVSAATVHLTGAGSCTVTASQVGNANYDAAPDVSRTFSITPTTRPTRCTVPKLVGKQLAVARLAIKAGHCGSGKVGLAFSPKGKKGAVISQSRRPGELLPGNSKINLVVSRGRKR
jgi:hypothetical protein